MIKGLSDRVKVKGLQAESYREKLVQQESRDERKRRVGEGDFRF